MTAVSLPYTELPNGIREVCVGGKVYQAWRFGALDGATWTLTYRGRHISVEPTWADVCSRIRGGG